MKMMVKLVKTNYASSTPLMSDLNMVINLTTNLCYSVTTN